MFYRTCFLTARSDFAPKLVDDVAASIGVGRADLHVVCCVLNSLEI